MILWLFQTIAGLTVLLLCVRCVAALLLPVADCDEVFNYWEPAHYLLHHDDDQHQVITTTDHRNVSDSLQTWEYSPEYGLRSWLFLWLYVWPVVAIRTVLGTAIMKKTTEYFVCRIWTAMVSVLADRLLLTSVYTSFGRNTMSMLGCVLVFSTGVTQASVSFLPSSFAMTCFTVALACWIRATVDTPIHSWKQQQQQHHLCTFSSIFLGGKNVSAAMCLWMMCCATIVGWPFAGLIGAPIGLSLLWSFGRRGSVWIFLCVGLFVTVISLSVAYVDGLYYMCDTRTFWEFVLEMKDSAMVKAMTAYNDFVAFVENNDGDEVMASSSSSTTSASFVFSSWNIVAYNVFGGEGRGPELYGVEPRTFFVSNLLVNFNICFFLSAMPCFLLMVSSRIRSRVLYVTPFYLWFAFWLFVPHKEERFMCPAYPFLSLGAAFVLQWFLGDSYHQHVKKKSGKKRRGMFGEEVKEEEEEAKEAFLTQLFRTVCTVSILTVFIVVSVLRTSALIALYSGPQSLLLSVHDNQHLWKRAPSTPHHNPQQQQQEPKSGEKDTHDDTSSITVCTGKEWYRFPSHFFLPNGVSLKFFKPAGAALGALPKPFLRGDGNTSSFHYAAATCANRQQDFNDLNQEMAGQYVSNPGKECDFFMESVVLDAPLSPSSSSSSRGVGVGSVEMKRALPHLESSEEVLDVTPYYRRRAFFGGESGNAISNKRSNDILSTVLHWLDSVVFSWEAYQDHRLINQGVRSPFLCRVLYVPTWISKSFLVRAASKLLPFLGGGGNNSSCTASYSYMKLWRNLAK